MNDAKLYLKEEVYFEPLFNSWYAWPYLIAPVQAARYLVNTHQRLMKSFVANHKLHILLSKEPGMAGGDYLACTEDDVEPIRGLIDDTTARCSDLVKLSAAVDALEDLLRRHTSGETIEPLYRQVPDELQGYVELHMDAEHRASYRLLEGLLYRSKFYRPDLQSVSFGLLSPDGDRPFVLSTPRLPDRRHLQLEGIGFASPVLERILQAREVPLRPAEIEQLFAQCTVVGGLPYQQLFTTCPPARRHLPVECGVRQQYLGHAGFLVETPRIALLVDPVIAVRGERNADQIISFAELPAKIDYVCLTHSHQDHVNLETLLQLRYKIDHVLVPKNNGGSLHDPSLRLMLTRLGFRVTEVDDLEEIAIPGEGRITSVPFFGEHGDLNVRSKTAWHLALRGKNMMFTADSANLAPAAYRHVHDLLGDMDVMAIGMECVGAPYTWLYGALQTRPVSKAVRDSRRLNGCDMEKAISLVQIFNPAQVFVYALGMEPWYKYFMGIEYDSDSKQIIESSKMVAACHQAGIAAESLFGKRTLELG